ncbi:hypothetical protein A0H81_02077 [Grifola frondosa]|uniref:Uncharacterized protein n=1 Tax=Grifola frondosa TaxID=5627 RepID=A0A1C7MN93_GRIFR|nr:hypothetical protein A0H81_02077 [Grifola frondosa]
MACACPRPMPRWTAVLALFLSASCIPGTAEAAIVQPLVYPSGFGDHFDVLLGLAAPATMLVVPRQQVSGPSPSQTSVSASASASASSSSSEAPQSASTVAPSATTSVAATSSDSILSESLTSFISSSSVETSSSIHVETSSSSTTGPGSSSTLPSSSSASQIDSTSSEPTPLVGSSSSADSATLAPSSTSSETTCPTGSSSSAHSVDHSSTTAASSASQTDSASSESTPLVGSSSSADIASGSSTIASLTSSFVSQTDSTSSESTPSALVGSSSSGSSTTTSLASPSTSSEPARPTGSSPSDTAGYSSPCLVVHVPDKLDIGIGASRIFHRKLVFCSSELVFWDSASRSSTTASLASLFASQTDAMPSESTPSTSLAGTSSSTDSAGPSSTTPSLASPSTSPEPTPPAGSSSSADSASRSSTVASLASFFASQTDATPSESTPSTSLAGTSSSTDSAGPSSTTPSPAPPPTSSEPTPPAGSSSSAGYSSTIASSSTSQTSSMSESAPPTSSIESSSFTDSAGPSSTTASLAPSSTSSEPTSLVGSSSSAGDSSTTVSLVSLSASQTDAMPSESTPPPSSARSSSSADSASGSSPTASLAPPSTSFEPTSSVESSSSADSASGSSTIASLTPSSEPTPPAGSSSSADSVGGSSTTASLASPSASQIDPTSSESTPPTLGGSSSSGSSATASPASPSASYEPTPPAGSSSSADSAGGSSTISSLVPSLTSSGISVPWSTDPDPPSGSSSADSSSIGASAIPSSDAMSSSSSATDPGPTTSVSLTTDPNTSTASGVASSTISSASAGSGVSSTSATTVDPSSSATPTSTSVPSTSVSTSVSISSSPTSITSSEVTSSSVTMSGCFSKHHLFSTDVLLDIDTRFRFYLSSGHADTRADAAFVYNDHRHVILIRQQLLHDVFRVHIVFIDIVQADAAAICHARLDFSPCGFIASADGPDYAVYDDDADVDILERLIVGTTTYTTVVATGTLIPNATSGSDNIFAHNSGALAGLIIGVIAFVLLMAALIFLAYRRQRMHRLEADVAAAALVSRSGLRIRALDDDDDQGASGMAERFDSGSVTRFSIGTYDRLRGGNMASSSREDGLGGSASDRRGKDDVGDGPESRVGSVALTHPPNSSARDISSLADAALGPSLPPVRPPLRVHLRHSSSGPGPEPAAWLGGEDISFDAADDPFKDPLPPPSPVLLSSLYGRSEEDAQLGSPVSENFERDLLALAAVGNAYVSRTASRSSHEHGGYTSAPGSSAHGQEGLGVIGAGSSNGHGGSSSGHKGRWEALAWAIEPSADTGAAGGSAHGVSRGGRGWKPGFAEEDEHPGEVASWTEDPEWEWVVPFDPLRVGYRSDSPSFANTRPIIHNIHSTAEQPENVVLRAPEAGDGSHEELDGVFGFLAAACACARAVSIYSGPVHTPRAVACAGKPPRPLLWASGDIPEDEVHTGAPAWSNLGPYLSVPDMPSPALTEGSYVPEGLLDPRLGLRLGSKGMQSSGTISFKDDMDYSRPIGGLVNNRQHSSTTFQSLDTHDSREKDTHGQPSEDSRRMPSPSPS